MLSEYRKAYLRKYYRENRERVKSQKLASYYRHREARKAKMRDYYRRSKRT